MTQLVKYEAACRAVAEAVSIDEAKEFRDQSEAMRAYAKQAIDRPPAAAVRTDDPDEAAAVKQAGITLAALVATRDAVQRARDTL